MDKKYSNFPTIDLHGYTKEAAKEVLEDFVDDLIKMGMPGGIVIHGRGSGLLKEVTHDFLKHNSNVTDIHLDYYNVGVTYFTLKNNKYEEEIIKKEIEKVTETSIIKDISIRNLFGCFNYYVDFSNSNVFIVHAPNGTGKSHFLKYIQQVLNGDSESLMKAPFEELNINTTKLNRVIKPYTINLEVSSYSDDNKEFKLPECNYIGDLYTYDFGSRGIDNLKKYDIFQEILDDFFCFEKIIKVKTGKYGKNAFDIIYDYDSKYTNPSILKKGDKLAFDELSSGEKFIIKLFYKLIFDLTNNSFVVIDEPELSLHVEWQDLLIKNIVKISKKFDVNILIVTHSPHIVNHPDVEVGVVEYEEE